MAVKSVQVIINGASHTLTLNEDTGMYEAQITAPGKSSFNLANGYYPVTVKATDDAGNTTTVSDTDATLGDSLKLKVVETVKPVISITSPTESQKLTTSNPTITWTVTDDDSGVDADTIGITIDGGSKITTGITKTVITGGYQCTYVVDTALTDGSHTIYVDASDNDGNEAVQRTVNFVVDTVPPTLSVTSPANNLVTNESTVTVAGVTNDVTSSPVTLTIKVNNGAEQAVTVGSNGEFSKEITLSAGSNTITVTATDAAGKSSSVQRTVTLDTGAPVISAVNITPNPVVAGQVITISVQVSD